ncbi:hypothetical protein J6590_018477 [Homalodisca vitripennis]|nr:hypothetical protein J6590_018477 [Homalodisca vitripennis]
MDESKKIKKQKIEHAGGSESKDSKEEEEKVSNRNEKSGKEVEAKDEDKGKYNVAQKSEINTKMNKRPDLRYYVKVKMKQTVIDMEVYIVLQYFTNH